MLRFSIGRTCRWFAMNASAAPRRLLFTTSTWCTSEMRRVLCELRDAVLEQVGKDQTDRLRNALSDAMSMQSVDLSYSRETARLASRRSQD